MDVLNVVGARPNMMKIAPIVEVMGRTKGIKQRLVHTGQHYDAKMSEIFFEELGIPEPDIYLGVGSGTHAEQTGRIMIAFEKLLIGQKPDLVLVVGDVNSTLACSITAAKLWIPVAHVEAGLRSFDWTMPEEINRIVTDRLSDFLFTTSKDANENLKAEGIAEDRIYFVGNVMIDTLRKHQDKATKLGTSQNFGLKKRNYSILTLHRPSNVDIPEVLEGIIDAIIDISVNIPVLFPAHPRTSKRLAEFGLLDKVEKAENLIMTNPLGYLPFLDLMMNARFVITDSGGIQEETTILSVPCITIRENTERPVTITEGTNRLVGINPERIVNAAKGILTGNEKKGGVPELWDGNAAERIVQVLKERIKN